MRTTFRGAHVSPGDRFRAKDPAVTVFDTGEQPSGRGRVATGYASSTHGLAFLAFGLSLLGAFLTRSGTTASVHAFAEARAVGRVLLAALVVTAVALVGLMVGRRRHAPSMPVRALTQAGAVRANNALLLAVIVAVGFGLLYPVLSGDGLIVTGRYFAVVTAPLALGVLSAIGVGPRLGWRPRPVAGGSQPPPPRGVGHLRPRRRPSHPRRSPPRPAGHDRPGRVRHRPDPRRVA